MHREKDIQLALRQSEIVKPTGELWISLHRLRHYLKLYKIRKSELQDYLMRYKYSPRLENEQDIQNLLFIIYEDASGETEYIKISLI